MQRQIKKIGALLAFPFLYFCAIASPTGDEKLACSHQCTHDEPLAISCLLFKAQVLHDGITISWNSLERDGSGSFELIKTADNQSTSFARFSSSKNWHKPVAHQVVDTVKAKSMYQLKRMEGDSSMEYYNPIYISNEMIAKSKVNFGPNPIKDGDRFQLFAYDCEELYATLSGRQKGVIVHLDLLDEVESQQFVEAVAHLQKGVYELEIRTEDQVVKRRLWRE